MITKVITSGSNQNGVKYGHLFNFASEALKKVYNDETFQISTLNEYFVNLDTLVSNDTIFQPQYVRLPIDEDFFEINANTREIKIPSSFKSGVGVQGDQAAETIFFIIDRYFDTMDLNNQNIYIEWKSPTRSGFSKDFARDIVSYPNKIIFGWVLQQEIMEAPGQIEFAVRFYTTEQDPESKDMVIKYSLSTKSQKVSVNKTLNFSLIDGLVDVFDAEDLVLSRITASKEDVGPNSPQMPEILRNITADNSSIFEVSEGVFKGYFNADDPEDYIVTLVNGYSPDAGSLIYELEFLGKDSNDWTIANEPVGKIKKIYDLTDDKIGPVENNSYYAMDEEILENGNTAITFTPISLIGIDFETETPEWESLGYKADNVYEEYAECYLGVAGQYRIGIKNRKGSIKTKNATYTNIVDIPYPIMPTVNEELQHIFFDDDSTDVILEVLGLEKHDDGKITCQWFKDEEEKTEAIENNFSYTAIAGEEGYYKVTVYNTLNKVTQEGPSCTYRVTYQPGTPIYAVNCDPSMNYPSMTELSIIVDPSDNPRADETYVTWYKATTFGVAADGEVVKEEAPITSADNNKSTYVGIDGQYYAVIRNKYNGKFSEAVTTKLWTIVG